MIKNSSLLVLSVLLWLTACTAATPTPEPTQVAVADVTETASPTPTSTPIPTATPDPTSTPAPTLGIGSTRIRPTDAAVMVYVPAGEFVMGSNIHGDEQPIHAVYLDAYWIDKTEVTNGMYAACVEDGACTQPSDLSSYTNDNYYPHSDYMDYPVIYVSWYDATAYCEWTGGRLPTEAEWEKAASWDEGQRKKHIYPWGETIDCDHANYDRCIGDTTAVGSYPKGASPYGTLDMAGNVWEWVNDIYGADYYKQLIYNNPTGPAEGTIGMVIRGGSWYFNASHIHTTNRVNHVPASSYDYSGFRCAQ